MKDLLTYILKNITTQPDEINVEEKEENGVTHFTITAHPDDIGRVIGRDGKIIKAIRTIMRVVAIQNDQRVRVTVISDVEEEQSDSESDTETESEDEDTTEQTNEVEQTTEQTPSPQEDSPQSEAQEESIELEL